MVLVGGFCLWLGLEVIRYLVFISSLFVFYFTLIGIFFGRGSIRLGGVDRGGLFVVV